MSPLILVFSFLMILGLITSSEIAQFHDGMIEKHIHACSLESNEQIEFTREVGLLDDFRGQPNPKTNEIKEKKVSDADEGKIFDTVKNRSIRRVPNLKINEDRPPNNSRLNLYLIMHDSKKGELYEIGARLLRGLYSDFAFFNDTADIEYRLLDALIGIKDDTNEFEYPDDLLNIQLQDEFLNSTFHRMLRGGDPIDKNPCLLNLITFDREENMTRNQKKINLMFASDIFLKAVFNHPSLEEAFLAFRNDLKEKLFQKDESIRDLKRSDISTLLKSKLEECCQQCGFPKEKYNSFFDFTLGHQGTIIFSKDPSGIIVRQKYRGRLN